jgi:hypothetical protein
MDHRADNFWDYLGEPLRGRARLVLIALIVPLLLSFAFPLWRISMKAPQYPDGLWLDIYSNELVGGNGGHDVQEINTLNHYIGMGRITRDELRDLDWMPFGIAAMVLLSLRCAVLGNVRALIDLSMVAAFIMVAAFGRFVAVLWRFGHDLDPTAPVRVQPFMPAVIGSKQIANFTTWSMPQLGSVCLGAFTVGIWCTTLLCLYAGRQRAAARAVLHRVVSA